MHRYLSTIFGIFLSLCFFAVSAQAQENCRFPEWTRGGGLALQMKCGSKAIRLPLGNSLNYAHVTEFSIDSDQDYLREMSEAEVLREIVRVGIYGDREVLSELGFRIEKHENLSGDEKAYQDEILEGVENFSIWTKEGKNAVIFVKESELETHFLLVHSYYDHETRLRSFQEDLREDLREDPLSATLLELYKPPIRDMGLIGQGVDACVRNAPRLLEASTWESLGPCVERLPSKILETFKGFGGDFVLVMKPGEYHPYDLDSPAMVFLSSLAIGFRKLFEEGVSDFQQGVREENPQLLASVVSPLAWEVFKIALPLKLMGKGSIRLPEFPEMMPPPSPAGALVLVSASIEVPSAQALGTAGTLFMFSSGSNWNRSRQRRNVLDARIRGYRERLERGLNIEDPARRRAYLSSLRKSVRTKRFDIVNGNGNPLPAEFLAVEREVIEAYWDDILAPWGKTSLNRPLSSFESSISRLEPRLLEDEMILGLEHRMKVQRRVDQIRSRLAGAGEGNLPLATSSNGFRKLGSQFQAAKNLPSLEERHLGLRSLRGKLRRKISEIRDRNGSAIPEDLLQLEKEVVEASWDESLKYWEANALKNGINSAEGTLRKMGPSLIKDAEVLGTEKAKVFHQRLQRIWDEVNLLKDGGLSTTSVLAQRLESYEEAIRSATNLEEIRLAVKKMADLRFERSFSEDATLRSHFFRLRGLYLERRVKMTFAEIREARKLDSPNFTNIFRRLQRIKNDVEKSGLTEGKKVSFLEEVKTETRFWTRRRRNR